jgi:hypothetical protein
MEQLSTTARDQSIWSQRASQSSSAKGIRSHTPANCRSRRPRQHVIPDPPRVPAGASARDAAAKDEENARQACAIRDARPPTFSPSRRNRRERFDKIPQRIWKQRGGHTRLRYVADEEPGFGVLLRALKALSGIAPDLVELRFDTKESEGYLLSFINVASLSPRWAVRRRARTTPSRQRLRTSAESKSRKPAETSSIAFERARHSALDCHSVNQLTANKLRSICGDLHGSMPTRDGSVARVDAGG